MLSDDRWFRNFSHIFSTIVTVKSKKAMNNVYTLGDINKKSYTLSTTGHQLGTTYEQELEEKLYSALSSKAEFRDLNGKLVDKYLKREKEYQRTNADIGNKISQLNASTTKVRSQLISEQKSHSESQRELEDEIKSLKSEIKILKRKETLAQKASSADKIQILSFKTKIHELEGKLKDIDLERIYHDLNVTGGVVEELAQISSSEIESFGLELE
ncbi:hypothetical protein C1646_677715 [Rhizophagus diaphanus]|nr:hypothetical protein C1646_677715 [Rhizophagus diaphanus] [Rhizophagus sp. MUCL 43196]